MSDSQGGDQQRPRRTRTVWGWLRNRFKNCSCYRASVIVKPGEGVINTQDEPVGDTLARLPSSSAPSGVVFTENKEDKEEEDLPPPGPQQTSAQQQVDHHQLPIVRQLSLPQSFYRSASSSSSGGPLSSSPAHHSLDQRWFDIAAKHAADSASRRKAIPKERLEPEEDEEEDDVELEAEVAAFRQAASVAAGGDGKTNPPRPKFTTLIEASMLSTGIRADPIASVNSFNLGPNSTFGRLTTRASEGSASISSLRSLNSDSSSADGGGGTPANRG